MFIYYKYVSNYSMGVLKTITNVLWWGDPEGEMTEEDYLAEYEDSENHEHPGRSTHEIKYIEDLEICTKCGMVGHYEYSTFGNRVLFMFRVSGKKLTEYDDWGKCPVS